MTHESHPPQLPSAEPQHVAEVIEEMYASDFSETPAERINRLTRHARAEYSDAMDELNYAVSLAQTGEGNFNDYQQQASERLYLGRLALVELGQPDPFVIPEEQG